MTYQVSDQSEYPTRRSVSAGLKRGLDIVLAVLALAVLAVPIMLVALVVRRHDHGPIFYRQTRVGLGGRSFTMLKFRSMIVDADQVGGYSTMTADSRITPVGRFLRRSSIDELPQLFNVLRGDMSIVGPRPDVPAQEALYDPVHWRLRHSVRPGITGLAQAVSRSTATATERTDLDLAYVRTASIGTDLKIILMTLRQLVAKTGN